MPVARTAKRGPMSVAEYLASKGVTTGQKPILTLVSKVQPNSAELAELKRRERIYQNSRLAMAGWDECEDVAVIGSPKQVPMFRYDQKKDRKHVCRRIGIGKRVPTLQYFRKDGEWGYHEVLECAHYHYVGGQKRNPRKPEYKDLRSDKFRVKHLHTVTGDIVAI